MNRSINLLKDIPDLVPIHREGFHKLSIRVFDRNEHNCMNYLSPNRREFYKVLMITEGTGVFTLGIHTYFIEEPTIIFIHPNDIISWKNLSEAAGGYYILFKKQVLETHPVLKSAIDRYSLFSDKNKSVIRLSGENMQVIKGIFSKMQEEELSGNVFNEEMMQTYLQLIIIESARVANFPAPAHTSEEYRHVHDFFKLLEQATAQINTSNPVGKKTAKEFAATLAVHPNHLNTLLKKHTGQNVSTHIRNRLLEEAKVLLVQTNWPLKDIGYCIGFPEQPNFNLFFKKNTGFTPAEFRKSIHL
ncbi:helix-turn-helix domain-containing protein [Chitinophaga sp. SYP-B3965]|uniref:AraC family transcriptional regulator n=1 Tax=Chitinophaga sp. SYP-B3965 TaxID=2663120 RepID=UPI0012999D5F|nr:AraC family transcriptional regulator [Chitinophaga sp. SYP-B3965]MRG44618.1 helix-turn-helix domain-containing protein [Chitinophaga sp. SYP-B3965]